MFNIIQVFFKGSPNSDFKGKVGFLHEVKPTHSGEVLIGARIKVIRPILGIIPIPLERWMVEYPFGAEGYIPIELFQPPLQEIIQRWKSDEEGKVLILGDYYGVASDVATVEVLQMKIRRMERDNQFDWERMKDLEKKMMALVKDVYELDIRKPIELVVEDIKALNRAASVREGRWDWGFGGQPPLSEEEQRRRWEERKYGEEGEPVKVVEKKEEKAGEKVGFLQRIRKGIFG